MEFYKWLNENWRDDQIKEILSNDCRPFLNDLKKCNNKFLYSGRKKIQNFYTSKVRKNRTPKNTPKELHEQLDNAFNDIFGIKARSQTLFCATKYTASRYGDPFYIFPIDKYEVIWSNKVEDLYIDNVLDLKDQNFEYVKNWVEENYQKGNLCKAIESGNEVMVYCDKYLAINTEAYNEESMTKLIKEL